MFKVHYYMTEQLFNHDVFSNSSDRIVALDDLKETKNLNNQFRTSIVIERVRACVSLRYVNIHAYIHTYSDFFF